MSSYWAGYHGLALVLSGEEFQAFTDAYCKAHPTDETARILKGGADENGYSIRELPFRASEEKSEFWKSEFYVTDVLTDSCEGMSLIPIHYPDGVTNTYERDEDGKLVRSVHVENLHGKNCYAFFADHEVTSGSYFDRKEDRYETYEDLLREFQGKLKAYLPEDFDWDAHIGDFSYACFA